MNKKIEEMVALGAAYALHCRPCMEVHRQKATEAGLTQEEMQAAIRIADAVREGAARKNRAFAEELFGSIKPDPCCPAGSSCCS